MGWVDGEWQESVMCEDAPCCGCCGPHGDGPDRFGGEDEPYEPDDYEGQYDPQEVVEDEDGYLADPRESPDPGWMNP